MDQLDNPYMNMIEIMRHQGSANNPIPFLLGRVVSVEPFLVQTEDIQLDREDVLINSSLLKGYKEEVKINATSVSGSLNTEHGGTLASFNMSSGTSEKLKDDFNVGDSLVLLVSADQQKYVVLCKVV